MIQIFLLLTGALMLLWSKEIGKLISPRMAGPKAAATFSYLLKVALFSVAGLMILEAIGVPVTLLVAVGGIGGLALAIAVETLLSNLFGGLMLMVQNTLSPNDWIKVDQIEGYVEEVGWSVTRIRSLDRRPIYIPNSTFLRCIVENPGRMDRRPFRHLIEIGCDEPRVLLPLIEKFNALLCDEGLIDQTKQHFATLAALGPRQATIELCAFTLTTDGVEFRKVQQLLLLRIDKAMAECGMEMPFQKLRVKSVSANLA